MLLGRTLIMVLILAAMVFPRVEAAFDFSLLVSPDNDTVLQGQGTTAKVNVTLVTGPVRTVTLTATTTPSTPSISAVLTPNTGDPTFQSTLTLSTLTSTPEGTYIITITGTSQGPTRTVNFTLTVLPAYTVSLSPTSGAVLPGGSVVTHVGVSTSGTFPEVVSLSCPGAPAGVSCSFLPSSGTPTFGSDLTISAAASLSPGAYPITVRGTSGTTALVKEATFTLLVPAVIVSPAINAADTGAQITISVEARGFPSFGSFDIIVAYTHETQGGPLDAIQIIVPSADADVWPAGATVFTTASSIDSKIKYVDSNSNNLWNSGEAVVYDSNGNSLFDSGETVIAGTAPAVGTSLKDDAKVRFADSNGDNLWNSGEAVVYDSNGNSLFDSGETVIAGTAPAAGTSLKNDLPVGQVRFSQASTLPTPPGVSGVLFSIKFTVTRFGSTSIAFTKDVVNLGGQVISHVSRTGVFCNNQGDVNKDAVVNIIDLARVGAAFGKSTGQPGYDVKTDVNKDGIINVIDLAIVGANFGRTCQP